MRGGDHFDGWLTDTVLPPKSLIYVKNCLLQPAEEDFKVLVQTDHSPVGSLSTSANNALLQSLLPDLGPCGSDLKGSSLRLCI